MQCLSLTYNLLIPETNTRFSTPALDACSSGTLPQSGLTINVPSLVTSAGGGTGVAPTVTVEAEGGAVANTDMVSAFLSGTVSKYSGMNTLSVELLERSGYPGFYEELKKQQQENKDKGEKSEQSEGGEGEGESGDPSDGLPDTFDDHSGWSDQSAEIDNTDNEIAKERLKEAIKKAAEECSKSNNWGSISAEQRKKIMESLQTSVDWRKMLRYFVKTSQRCDKSSTVRRINKRFPRIHAGKKVNRIAKIAISIDQSGSVSDTMLALFFSELNSLASIATFTVIPFDTVVNDSLVYEWKKGTKKEWNRVMCGGTDFNAPTKWVNKSGEFDGHIILTDMCAPKPVSSLVPRMWMTDKENAKNPYFKTNEIVVAVGK